MMDKKELRQQTREKLATLPQAEAALYDTQITEFFFQSQAFMPHTQVAAYMPLKGEVSCRTILNTLADKGHVTCLPAITSRNTPMVFRQYRLGDDLQRGILGPQEPLSTAREIIPDVLLIPMLGYTRQKYRLGYGSGFYDRTLEELLRLKSVRTIGLAYSLQEIEDLPVEPHDIPLDFIITEKEVIA